MSQRYHDDARSRRLDTDSFAGGYFKNAVYRHWDPYEDIPQEDLETDRERLIDHDGDEEQFDNLRQLLAMFGAGEEAVTEDLAPLSIVLEDVDDQMFISSQIYEEAKHAQFFDRYWYEVITPVAEAKGYEVTDPTDEQYFGEDYVELFDKNEAAVAQLLEEDTPRTRAEAVCHYHLVIESVLAQTAYYSIQSVYSDTGPENLSRVESPTLPGLVEGITRIRSDEGRHVGWGMNYVSELIEDGRVDPAVVQETLQELMPHVAGIIDESADEEYINPAPLAEYSQEKLERRVEIITESEADLPPVEELVAIEGGRDPTAAD